MVGVVLAVVWVMIGMVEMKMAGMKVLMMVATTMGLMTAAVMMRAGMMKELVWTNRAEGYHLLPVSMGWPVVLFPAQQVYHQ